MASKLKSKMISSNLVCPNCYTSISECKKERAQKLAHLKRLLIWQTKQIYADIWNWYLKKLYILNAKKLRFDQKYRRVCVRVRPPFAFHKTSSIFQPSKWMHEVRLSLSNIVRNFFLNQFQSLASVYSESHHITTIKYEWNVPFDISALDVSTTAFRIDFLIITQKQSQHICSITWINVFILKLTSRCFP